MKKIIYMLIVAIIMFSGCSQDDDSVNTVTPVVHLSKVELGEKIFSDKSISLARKISCATCHNPEYGFVDARFREDGANQNIFVNGAFSVGDDGISLGGRNAPTVAYAMFSPDFNKQSDGSYIGGQFHDGRKLDLKAQAGGPPLDGAEMQMVDKNAVVDRLKENKVYVDAFENLFGASIFDDVDSSYDAMTEVIADFEKTDEFSPFDSKYDKYINGEYTFTNDEELGYVLFFSNANRSCVKCHTLNSASEASSKEMFTNYKYENIGTPRNISAMDARVALGLQDANTTFKGLGGTVQSTDTNFAQHLGKTKVPTLRNVAVTGPYMNNGVFAKLRTVLEFYNHMAGNGDSATNPETTNTWISNDNNATINHTDLSQNAMSDTQIRALEAFLNTLTDEKYEHLIPVLAPAGAIGN